MQEAGVAPAWSDADVDESEVWRRSGAQWLTAPGVSVPVRMVRRLAGMIEYLDARGARLGQTFAASGIGVLAERGAVLSLRAATSTSCGGATRLVQCSDSWLAVSLARPDDAMLVPAWLDVDPDRCAGECWDVIAREIRDREPSDVVGRAAELGLACAALGETTADDGARTERRGTAPASQIDGLRVVNLASLWAGPLAADVLARLGARVVNVESTTRPDGARHTPAFYDALRRRTSLVTLDLGSPTGQEQLAELLATADVVIEGSRPRALRQLGIDALSLVDQGPRIWVSITGHGRVQGNRVGFGDDCAAAGGLVGWRYDGPTFLADAVADPLTGVTAAATVVRLAEHGGRWIVDAALARVARELATRQGDLVVGPLDTPCPPTRRTEVPPANLTHGGQRRTANDRT